MPRRARHLIPTQLPRRGEVVAAFAVLVLVAHLLLAQLTFVLAVVFAAVSKTTQMAAVVARGPGGGRAGLDAGDRAEGGGRRTSPPDPPRSSPT